MITLMFLYFCVAIGAESDKMANKLLTNNTKVEL